MEERREVKRYVYGTTLYVWSKLGIVVGVASLECNFKPIRVVGKSN